MYFAPAAGTVEVRGLNGLPWARARVARSGAKGGAAEPVDVVVWNPGEAKGGAIPDLGAGEWRDYVCVEPGRVSEATARAGELAPGEVFTLTQTLELLAEEA